MVQRDQWDTYWGPKKIIFLIRDIDGPTMTASCRFAARRSPGGRFWSVVDVGKRLHRTRGGFHRCIHISKVLCALWLWTMIPQSFGSRALWRAPSTDTDGVVRRPAGGLVWPNGVPTWRRQHQCKSLDWPIRFPRGAVTGCENQCKSYESAARCPEEPEGRPAAW